ncbi:signal peptidase II [Desulfogranum japonicum]|uniref:signal peptidase II n=1 Tax=Desulfogranum japonicum TaxID=231447 RepID=UPI00041716E8|nr:signal peptidase II [Desulfogranum japonicum]
MQFVIILILVVCADQFSKLLVLSNMDLYESISVVPGLFNLTFMTNNGAAFSLLAGQPALWRQLFFIFTASLALVVLVFAHRSFSRSHKLYGVAFGLIAGGAVGNLIDRVRLGHVIDFLDVYVNGWHWPAFNVADSAITVGVILFLVINFVLERQQRKEQMIKS